MYYTSDEKMDREVLHDLLAALISERFEGSRPESDWDGPRSAWSRLFQNDGWDDTPESREIFNRMVRRGKRALADCGFCGVR